MAALKIRKANISSGQKSEPKAKLKSGPWNKILALSPNNTVNYCRLQKKAVLQAKNSNFPVWTVENVDFTSNVWNDQRPNLLEEKALLYKNAKIQSTFGKRGGYTSDSPNPAAGLRGQLDC